MSKNPKPCSDLTPTHRTVSRSDSGVQAKAQTNTLTWKQGAATAAIPILTVADLVLHQRIAVTLLAVACLIFLLLQHRHIAVGIRRTSTALTVLMAALLPTINMPAQALESGVRIGGLIASLLISVNLLSRAALRVPRMRQVVANLFALPRSQRPLALGIASQFLGGFLGLAGLTMMMNMAAQRDDVPDTDKIADFSAISRGYAALTLWSPMYSNMSIVLTLYKGIRWNDVLPYALTISAAFIGLGTLVEKLKRERTRQPEPPTLSAIALLRESLPVITLMLCFVAFMVLTSSHLHVSISAVIISGAPMLAWLLNVMHPTEPNHRWSAGSRQLKHDLLAQSTIAAEVMLFLASGCAGTVFSQAMPASWSAAIAQTTAHSPYLGCLLVMTAILLLSGTSMHPMLSAILVGSSLPPALLGLPATVHLCAVLVGWGLAIITTPFSVISLMAARFSGISILVISLRANIVFTLVCMGCAALALGSATWVTQH